MKKADSIIIQNMNSILPKEIIIQIFTFTDILTLRQLFFTCKNFCDMITNSTPIKMHILNSDPNLKYVCPHLFILFKPSINTILYYLKSVIEYPHKILNCMVKSKFYVRECGLSTIIFIFRNEFTTYKIKIEETRLAQKYIYHNYYIRNERFILDTPVENKSIILSCKYPARTISHYNIYEKTESTYYRLVFLPRENSTDIFKELLYIKNHEASSVTFYHNDIMESRDHHFCLDYKLINYLPAPQKLELCTFKKLNLEIIFNNFKEYPIYCAHYLSYLT